MQDVCLPILQQVWANVYLHCNKFCKIYKISICLYWMLQFTTWFLLPLKSNAWSSGPLSSVWKDWVKWCIEFGIEANAIIAVPYDWRLSPSKLEERDLYFHKLKFVYILHSFFLALLFTGCDAHFLIDCFLVLELF